MENNKLLFSSDNANQEEPRVIRFSAGVLEVAEDDFGSETRKLASSDATTRFGLAIQLEGYLQTVFCGVETAEPLYNAQIEIKDDITYVSLIYLPNFYSPARRFGIATTDRNNKLFLISVEFAWDPVLSPIDYERFGDYYQIAGYDTYGFREAICEVISNRLIAARISRSEMYEWFDEESELLFDGRGGKDG